MATKRETTLSIEQREKLAAHLKAKAPNFACPVCAAKSFSIGDVALSGNAIGSDGSINMGGTIVPTVMVVCENCYHVLSFAAVPIGVISKGPNGDG